MENYVNSQTVLKTFGISRTTLHRMEKQGLPMLVVGKSKRYNLEEVKAWIDSRQRGISNLEVGEAYRNDEIAKAFNCSTQGGMRRSHTTNTLVVFSDHNGSDYEDVWTTNANEEDVLLYVGMGKKERGNQDINFGQNKTLNESKENGIRVYLFESYEPGEHIFRGQVALAGDPYTDKQAGRLVWIFPLKIVGNNILIPEDILKKNKEQKQKEAEKLDMNGLLERARNVKMPSRRTVKSKTYQRDPYVSEYAKRRAEGICDLCQQPAPFKDRKGNPYLESHHVYWLSRGGDDTIYNTVALDPSCHRKVHVLDDPEDVQQLLEKLDQYRLKETE